MIVTNPNHSKFALVIGGSKGIGKATAEYFCDHQIPCIATGRSFKNQEISELAAEGVLEFHLDVTSLASTAKLFDTLDKQNLTPDYIIFCAGVGHFAPLEKISIKDWQETIETNLTGAFRALGEAYRLLLKKKKSCRIMIVGSISDHLALHKNAAYAASKFGLRGLAAVMHEEGKAHGISTTLISLGATYSEIWSTRPEFSASDMLSTAEVAETIFKLATLPAKITIPNVTITPPKGVL
jgi:NAD(P)-dependent dehydrogenase (short-subunit alcohol dehydrogenase family)